MSRSRLRNKWVRRRENLDDITSSNGRKNKHRLDNMPRNRPSRMVSSHCSADIDWLEHPGSFGGHKPRPGGHRLVSGLVRASLKREMQRKLLEETTQDNQE